MITPERRAEIDKTLKHGDAFSYTHGMVRELLAEVDRLTLALGGIEQVKRLGGHDEVMIVSMQDYDELQRLRTEVARLRIIAFGPDAERDAREGAE